MINDGWTTTEAGAHAKCYLCKKRIAKGATYMLRDLGYAKDRAHVDCWRAHVLPKLKDTRTDEQRYYEEESCTKRGQ